MNGALVSLGSDTGGSVRQPASFCGVVGLKPTYGAVSRYGLMAMGSSLDQIGPIGRTVSDVETVFNAIKGLDPMDSTTIPQKELSVDRNKLKIGIPKDLIEAIKSSQKSADVYSNFLESVSRLKDLGYETIDIDLPNSRYALPVYYIVMPAEVSSNMARFDGVKYGLHVGGETGIQDYFKTRGQGFGKEVRRRILLGTYVLSSGYYDAYYGRANALRELITLDFKKAFEKVDIIITPTTPSPAFKIGEKTNDPLSMYLEDIFTVTANLTGLPAMSVPSGKSGVLPLGLQMTGRHGEEKNLFMVGKDFLGE
jgi:aspartyl-tRNA(Asn)/glutamyl-tRNA(Gln) amidotransferase subunit A